MKSFCSYFSYTAKLCINGHEYLKCQLDRRGIDYEGLDNGISWCEQVAAAQVQLIFCRKLKKSTVTDGRCRTRIINEGVIPSLHIYYKHTHSKQYCLRRHWA